MNALKIILEKKPASFASPLEVWRILFRFSLFQWSSMNLVLDVFPAAPLEVGHCLGFVFVAVMTLVMA